MLEFKPGEPFPILEQGKHSYFEAQMHAERVDAWLGLEIEKIEKLLSTKGCRQRAPSASGEKQELWIGLASRSLLTPYTEIREMLAFLSPAAGTSIVDLGAAYGRMAFVVGRHYPNVQFTGYEFVGERVKEARRCLEKHDYPNVRVQHADLTSKEFATPSADIYFIYDFGTPQAIEKIMHDLKHIAASRPITVVGRGRSSRDIIERHHPWLSQVVKPEHRGPYSVYRSA